MDAADFPSQNDWRKLASTWPFEKLQVSMDDFETKGRGLEDFTKNNQLRTWAIHLHNRIYDVFRSYVMLRFYFEKGIPDEEWYISPGRKGESIRYFPHFEPVHFRIKEQFDYYADAFYYKLFTAFDTLGHLLNTRFDLGLSQKSTTFSEAIKRLRGRNRALFTTLCTIKHDVDFKKARQLRHEVTHNYLPHSIGPTVTKSAAGNVTHFGVGSYTPSKEIEENVLKMLDLLRRAVEACKS
jgi:Cthe_2314-like HEPN